MEIYPSLFFPLTFFSDYSFIYCSFSTVSYFFSEFMRCGTVTSTFISRSATPIVKTRPLLTPFCFTHCSIPYYIVHLRNLVLHIGFYRSSRNKFHPLNE